MVTRARTLVARRIAALRRSHRDAGLRGVAEKLEQAVRYRGRAARQRVLPKKEGLGDAAPGRRTGAATVTSIIVSKDCDESLAASLRRIQLRTDSDWECIVVDDDSSDRTLEVAQRFAEVDSRFTILKTPGIGLDSARRAALGFVGTEHVQFVSVEEARSTAPQVRTVDALVVGVERRVPDDVAAPRLVAAGAVEEVGGSAEGRILLLADAQYHVAELGPLSLELRARGRDVQFMFPPQSSPSVRYALGEFTSTALPFDVEVAERATAIVLMNDWGVNRELVERANAAGVPTFAKVEGVQDFGDVDTGRVRRPYRTARHILAQGANDVRALPDADVHVVGSSRLERLWVPEPAVSDDLVLVNLNFTFRVLTQERDLWLSTVRRAVKNLGVRAIVSSHPAESARPPGLDVSTKPFRYDVQRAGVLITRFSTVPFEALALGVPFIYHNPHHEQVPAFRDPAGAFDATFGVDDLELAITAALDGQPRTRTAKEQAFFADQVDIDPERTSAQRTADVVLGAIDASPAR